MPWFKVDDGLASKLETTRIPRAHRAAAIGLWALAGSWSARELTDGFVPEHMIDELAGTTESAAWLVSSEYWARVEGGFQFVTWEGEQPTRAKTLEQRAKNNAKVANWRSKNAKPSGDDVSNPVTPASRNSVTNPAPDPTRPDPSPSGEEGAPAPTCRRHSSWDHNDPCRACGADREAHEAWTARLNQQWDAALKASPPVPIRPSTMSERIEDCGDHRWLTDSTCIRCEQRREHRDLGAA